MTPKQLRSFYLCEQLRQDYDRAVRQRDEAIRQRDEALKALEQVAILEAAQYEYDGRFCHENSD